MDVQAPTSSVGRRTLLVESFLVLGVGLGASAVWAVLSIVRRLTDPVALSRQTSSLNASVTPDRPWLDLAYQLAGIALPLFPALLALHLLARDGVFPARIGMDLKHPGGDLLRGALLAAAVGLPGLVFYVAAMQWGINTTVSPAGLGQVWWAVPVLILSAVKNAVVEEVVMVGYLMTRWRQVGWSWHWVVGISAVIRGAYHLYQGFGGFLGNIAMGLFFGWLFVRSGRVMPLVVAHTLLDVVAFVGYTFLRNNLPWL
ncbi:CPBP family intramembrane glutamic endopeptidase [Austwickia chelonae]|uniref:CPBP family intramembrane glutamic endopeptidase n=1 Tax=Austwickia chelonae TaxID=100225 RepID=UPI000E22F27A|nr:CPBP family intramembrane glutamic endopeptidase [Austwickia chelonae]